LDSNFMKFIVDDKTVRNPISFYSQKSLSASLNVVWVDENAFALLANVLKRLDADSITLYDSTLCTSYSITTATDRDIGLTVVDFGYHMCRIMIFKNGIPRMYYAFPYGIRYVLKDIQNVIKTTEKEAHRLLSEEAVCLRDTNAKPKRVDFIPISGNGKSVISQNLLNKIVFARIREIISRMNGELSKKSYENTLEMGALQGGIIYTGGGSYIKNIESTIKDLMGKNFRKGIWVNKSFFKIPEDLKDDAEFIPVFSVLNKHLTEINETENEKIDFEEDNSPEPSSKNTGEKKSIIKNWFKKLSGGDE